MNTDKLKAKKAELEKQREQLVAQINYILGAMSQIDELLKEDETADK